MAISNLPSPSDLLGYGSYETWYPNQYELLQRSLDWFVSPTRFLGVAVSTGSGKSISAVLLSRLSEARTVILTATKGLQSQYASIVAPLGGVNVVGQGNFRCLLNRDLTADEGACHEGIACQLKAQCPYRVQLAKALDAKLVVTNYAYWLAQRNFSSGLGDVGLLICVPGDTKVTLSNGSPKRIDEIVDNRMLLSVKSVELSTGKVVDSCISGWHKIKYDMRLLHISTSLGELSLTSEHQVWTNRGYVQAGNLVVGDIVYGYLSEQGTVDCGESVRGCESSSGERERGICEPTYEDKSLVEAEESCGCQVRSPRQGMGRYAAEEGSQWRVGRLPVQVHNPVSGRAETILSTMLPEWSARGFSGVVRLSGCSRSRLVVHGQWESRGKQECSNFDALVRGGWQSPNIGLVETCLQCGQPRSRRQSREGVFSGVKCCGERPVVPTHPTICGVRDAVQGEVCNTDRNMHPVRQDVPEGTKRPLLLTGVPGKGAKATVTRLVSAEIRRIEKAESSGYVYDITVDKTHNFFANNILIKNCDEGHSCFGAMENYLTVFLSRLDLQPMGIDFSANAPDWSTWKTWATSASLVAEDSLSLLEDEVRDYRTNGGQPPSNLSRAYRTAKSVTAKLQRLASVSEDWIIQPTYHGYRFVPKWVANYSKHLFGDIPKVVLMSAILSHRSADYLGVSNGDTRSWIEMDSHFPPQNTPIWHIPTARINYRTDDYGTTLWCSRIDQIIDRRLDRKGIVFTVSYERAKLLLSRSRHREIMYTHSTEDVVRVVEHFKQLPAPAVLVSPSVTTGYDFPMDISGHGIPQYIVIGKLPYPDTKDPVTQARHEEDNDWTSYLAMETLIQSSGRTSRSATDKTEVLIVDDSWKWFWWKYRNLAPRWFQLRVRGSLETVPNPPF